MAIKAYTGLMGSGKSYEVVTCVILPAITKGRRVVTNIAGLDLDVFAELSGVARDQVQLVNVSHDQVTEPDFWLTDEKSEATIQPGDLLCLDEIWRFYDGFKTPPEPCMNFFRMHRHFVDAKTGATCDVVLITQDVMDIGPKVRRVVEETYRMSKLNFVGRPDRYRVDVFARGATKEKLKSLQKKYEAKYFPLYKSHSQKSDDSADANEVNVDDRGNILNSKFFKVVVPLALLFSLLSGYYVLQFFTKKPKQEETKQAESSQDKNKPKQTGPAQVNPDRRVVGYTQTESGTVVYAYDGKAVEPLFRAPATKITTLTIEALDHDGKIISNTTFVEPAHTKPADELGAK
jgi:zona occludens toxin